MRNLILHHTNLFTLIQDEPLSVYIDEFSKIVVTINKLLQIHVFKYEDVFMNFKQQKIILLTNIIKNNSEILEDIVSSEIKLFLYKNEDESIHFILSSGKYLKISSNDMFECISICDCNVLAAEISPNLERIAISLSNYTLLLLNYEFELIKSCNLDDFDQSDTKLDNNICNESSISWRGDSQFFSCLYSINGGKKCLVRDINLNIFKGPARADNKVVFSVAEQPVKNYANIVSWQPQGGLIAFFQNSSTGSIVNDVNSKSGVLFTEKNCLRHGEFYLNENAKAKCIKWNMDLPLLLVYLEIQSDKETYYRLDIYYRSNYEWSLKQSLRVEDLLYIRFSDLVSLRLFLMYKNGKFQIMEYRLDYNNSINSYCDNGSVAVINKNNLKFTPLGIVNIPPPMCLSTFLLNQGPYVLTWWKNYLFVLNYNEINVFNTSGRDYKVLINIPNIKLDTRLVKNFIFTTIQNKGYFIINSAKEESQYIDELITFIVEFEEKEGIIFFKIDTIKKIIVDIEKCLYLFNSTVSDKLYEDKYYELEEEKDDLFYGLEKKKDKYFFMITQNGDERIFNKVYIKHDEYDISEISYSSKYDIIKAKSIILNKEEKIVYLTKNNRLYIGNKLLGNDITSFEYFKKFLIVTQTSNTPYNSLHIIDLHNNTLLSGANNDETIFNPNFNYKTFDIRTIERGANIVTVSGVNLILQMPRGNLETIYPRLLVINLISDLISQKRYGESFELVRKHKINTSILYDTDPECFMENVSLFVKQIDKADYINLFINSLENNYCDEIKQTNISLNNYDDLKKLYINNKINKVCDSLRKELEILNSNNKYITSILHTHIKKNPPEYFNSLKLVQKLKIDEKKSMKLEELVNETTRKTADHALEYLCWIVNADTLFDFALKTYDFELVIMVAKHTQKDPKEYLPYLKKLQELDPVLMKYQINMDLKNYEDALYELSLGGEIYFEKSLELIKSHNLYDMSFNLFKENESLFSTVCNYYGEYLMNNKNYFDAGYAYLRGKNYSKSLESFIQSGAVNEITSLLIKLKYDIRMKQDVFLEVIDICTSAGKCKEIENLLSYLRDKEYFMENLNLQSSLMNSLIRLKRWKLSYLFYFETTFPSVKEEFISGINLEANLKINEFKKNKEFFEEKYNRLLKVQHMKRTNPQLYIVDNKMLEDNVSDTGSVVSSKSSKSKKSTSSKHTRKSKNKISKRTVKEGSPLEEEYLIIILSELRLKDEDITSIKEFISILNFLKLTENSISINQLLSDYTLNVIPNLTLFSIAQQDIIDKNPEMKEHFSNLFLPQSDKKTSIIHKD